ncbi:MAG: hypothetical protein NTV46_00950 [Verrucomicrobia bacterium]|nr:hypothetical protein [Verrucomicrobiota bacterium]
MKIPTWIHPEPLEVDVEVSLEDIRNALDESPETEREAFALLNQCSVCMKAITPEMIAGMSDKQRERIMEFLTAQAARYGQNRIIEPPVVIGGCYTTRC